MDFEKIKDLISKYVEVKSELIKIQVKEQISAVLSRIVLIFTFLMFGFLIVIVGSFAVGYYLNEILVSRYMGFVILTGAYIIVFIIAFLVRKSIIRKVIYYVIIEDRFEPDGNLPETSQDG